MISGIHSHEYHVTLSSSDHCPIQPCFTLSKLASNISNYLSSDTTTLLLQPGVHILENCLKISDVLKLIMEKSNLSLHTKIICKQPSAFHLYRIPVVHINGLVFMSCGGSKAEEVGQLLIRGTSFHGQGSQRTALEVVEVTGVIKDSTFQFHFNTAGNLKNVTVEEWKTKRIQASHAGGALSVTKSNITIIRSMFKSNGADVGGAVFCELERQS